MAKYATIRRGCARLLGSLLLTPLLLTTASCSDWDDHYDADTQLLDSQKGSLWENISKKGELSQFASLLQQTGYGDVLNQPQTYTVWAPANNSFDYESLRSTNQERLVREFVENHIARNLYPASGNVDQKVLMLNDKMMHFQGAGSYHIQDVNVSQANVSAGNGTLHVLQSQIPFLPNIYESLNNETYPIDSISDFYHKYDISVLNTAKSVPGPTKNGEITYLDSIIEKDNSLYYQFNAYINREDSNYTMLLPTNEAWLKAKNAVSQYYNYVESFDVNDSVASMSKGHITRARINAEYLRDSLVQHFLLDNLTYNNNIYDNTGLKTLQAGETLQCDSLTSTTFAKLYSTDAAALFQDAQRVDKSNGAVWVADSLNIPHWTTWCPELRQEAESNLLLAGVFNGSYEQRVVNATAQNPAITGAISSRRYLEISPASSSSNPEVAFYLRGVRSATYNVYVVTVPANITNANRDTLPNRLIVTMCYAKANGALDEMRMRSPVTNSNVHLTNPSKIDTLCLGEFTFPTAYYGLGSSSQPYYPYIRLRSNVTNAQSASYDRTLRIDRIILRPKMLDEYLQAHPDYKYN